MSATTMQALPVQAIGKTIGWLLRFGVLVIMWMIHSPRWHGWKLMLSMSVAYSL